jgi:hypothetical protein
METSQTPVIPVKQAMVNIAGHSVLGVLLEGGYVAASLRMICDLINVDYMGQMRKIRADRAIYDSLILATVETAGGPQETNVIIAEAIPIWLKAIQPSRVSPAARETLIEFQRVAVQTLRAFFFPETKAGPAQSAPPKEAPAQSAPPKEEPEPASLPPPEEEVPYWHGIYGGLIGLEQHTRELAVFQKRTKAEMVRIQQYLTEHADALNRHDEALQQIKEMLRQHEAWIGNLSEQVQMLTALVNRLLAAGSLTADHYGELRARIRAAAHQAGQPASAIERELTAALGVETLSQLTESAWGEIAAWFQARLGW